MCKTGESIQMSRSTVTRNVFSHDNATEELFRSADRDLQSIMLGFGQSNVAKVVQTRQTVPNCGCVAGAMAVCSLLNPKKIYEETNSEIKRELVFDLASDIQMIGMRKAKTSIGEMFDADALAETLTEYGQEIKTGESDASEGPKRKIAARVYRFDAENKLKQAIKLAKARGVRVLIPYYADAIALPIVPKNKDVHGRALPTDMAHAHWGLADEIDEHNNVKIYEGNMALNGHGQPLDALYISNNSLGDEFEWNEGFLNRLGDRDYALASRIALQQRWEYLRNEGIINEDADHVREHVNLRGSLVLVGFVDAGQ